MKRSLLSGHRAVALVAGVLLLCAAPSPAFAQSAAEVATRAGLIGWWADDCSKPPAADNLYAKYTAEPDGRVKRRWYGHGDVPDGFESYLTAMRPAGEDRFDVEIDQAPHGLFLGTVEIAGNRKRTIHLETIFGGVLVRDTIDATTGKVWEPEFKCPAPDLS